jgi:hypothetical protein
MNETKLTFEADLRKGKQLLSQVPKRPVTLRGELWGVTTYFNPAGYPNKPELLQIFATRIRRQGLKLMVVELAFDSLPFVLPDGVADRIIRIRTNTVLWHKERLLNLAFDALPAECDRIAWLDSDIIFENDRWVEETADLLETYVVVQPFDTAWWLLPTCDLSPSSGLGESLRGNSERSRLGAACYELLERGKFCTRGHVGFGWAARRSLLTTHGLYDRCIVGGGDTAISLAMLGYSSNQAPRRMLYAVCSQPQASDIIGWANGFCEAVQGSVCFTPGSAYHMWHGAVADRQYVERLNILRSAAFDPCKDIALDGSGCWQWNSEKPELHSNVRKYFWTRKEQA